MRRSLALALFAATALLLGSGCGGGSGSTRTSAATVLMAAAPDSLDPAVGDNAEAFEADWLVYTPLLTYAHAGGVAGTHVVAGLAQTLPDVSGGGTLYSFKLRRGLRYSNGQLVRASDFTWAVKRAIKLWPGAKQFITGTIVGASAFAAGRASTISGISTDDTTGQITVQLTAANSTFENVLAMPALAPVPAETPFRDQPTPPPGAGPYRITRIEPGRSFSLIRNPGWQKLAIQNVPAGRLDIDVRITGDLTANARAVLGNDADVFDSAAQIPSDLLGQVERRATGRYFRRTMTGTYAIFLDPNRKPFSSQLAREAVRAGLDEQAMAQLDSGMPLAGCYVLPPSIYGHPQDACPDGNKTGAGDLALARTLVTRSGMAGTPVVVWSPESSPVRRWMAYYTSLLNRIGFRASLEFVAGNVGPGQALQTGYVYLTAQLPNPVALYQQLTSPPVHLEDAYIEDTLKELATVPGSTVGAVVSYWHQLERYVADRAYLAVFGYPTFPKFVSSRIDFKRLVFSPVAGDDWSSLQLK